MARDKQPPPPRDTGWERVEKLLASGSPHLADAVRAVSDAKKLGPLAETWYNDPRPALRKALHDYLQQPFNALRHEPLVKRLFKFAEAAGDDATMARFLVGFDRLVRRKRVTKKRWNYKEREFDEVEVISTPADTTLERDDRNIDTKWFRQNKERFLENRFLFSVPTRNYLRRRAWRYFRRLGRQHPERYVPAVVAALKLYTDADCGDGLALIDNWGLTHILFHFSPALVARPAGWRVAEGQSLGALQPEPMFRPLWLQDADALFELVENARSRPVRSWASWMLRRHFADRLAALPLEKLFAWLLADLPELNDLAVEGLEKAPGLESVSVETWLKLTESGRTDLLDRICGLIAKHVSPYQVSFADAVKIALQRPVPLARLGLAFLTPKRPNTLADVQAVFSLREAEAEPVRPELIRWACGVLAEHPAFDPGWPLEFLDSRHADVREHGWAWLAIEPRANENVTVWQRLLESPYDDIRMRLVGFLEERATQPKEMEKYSPGLVRFLWATVLLNIHRGGRAKPFVVRQIVVRLAQKPDEADDLLPVLGVALRSVRGPEFRAGLSGVAAFVARHPQRRSVVEKAFPELKLSS